ncbi:MAG TPA: alpha/beta hydrolase-fold protein, partial [Vicinamibacteria bacterium]|nr:alpha/beta hydrolase-fold protein [Vicinamibacteria bacterium]
MRLPIASALIASLLAAASAQAEVRTTTFHSTALGRDVSCSIQLPPSYATGSRIYPVVYALHGLFENQQFWERRGLAAILDDLWAKQAVTEFVLVAVDGGNSFFVNSPLGRYEDLVTQDTMAFAESNFRVRRERGGRALFGVSMGGYAALRIALSHPELYAAAATHSAMLLSAPPRPGQGADPYQLAAFARVFGEPPDLELWRASDPLEWAQRGTPSSMPALSFDCGDHDRYGLAAGQQELHRRLLARGIAHEFALHPGDHGYEYVKSVLPLSLQFLSKH